MVEIDQRREPVGRDEAGITHDKEAAVIGIADFEIIEVDLDGRRGNDVADRHDATSKDFNRGAGGEGSGGGSARGSSSGFRSCGFGLFVEERKEGHRKNSNAKVQMSNECQSLNF